jgi:4-amino-4-deoxy-L-arabinose transferase-like glycosyltransferase
MHFAQTTSRNREYLFLAAILASGILLRAAVIIAMPVAPISDELAYQSIALNLINGHGFVDAAGNRAFYNVGYSLFVLAPAFLISANSLLVARILNLLLGGISILLCYATAQEAGLGRTGRLLAAAIWALDVSASVYTVYLAKENLMTPLMLGVIWCALRMMKSPSWKVVAGCGALFGVLALVGNAALCLASVVVVALYYAPVSTRRKIAASVLIVLVAAAVTAPWLARNRAVLGAPVLNTNGGFNLYLGNNPAATGQFISIAETPQGKNWRGMHKASEVQSSETLKRDAIAWIESHPARFLSLALHKAAYFWAPPIHEGKGHESKTAKSARVVWTIQFILIVAAAIGSLLLHRLWNRPMAILWIAVLSYTAVHMLFYVIIRYRMPIMPVMGILAALTIEAIAPFRRLSVQRSAGGRADDRERA